MARRAKRLVKPVIKEVSGVDHPAHLAGGWLVMKAAGDPDPDAADIYDALDDEFDDDDLDELHRLAHPEGADDVPDAVLAKQVADLRAELAVEKAARQAVEKAVTDAGGTVPVPDPAVIAAAATEAQEEEAFAKAVVGLPDATRVYLEGQRAEVRKAREDARTEREARLSREYLDVAKSQYRGVTAAPEQLATTLRTLDDRLPAAEAAEVKRLLKAAGAQAQFAELGGYGQQAPADGTIGEVAQVVAELQKADPSLSKAQAFVKAREAHPELAGKFTAEMQDRS